ncbi:NDP-hexose-3-ketoreductase [Kibdelosporangium banguiense]|uniref:NDP-hexose-3-ketoreductase n=1 Tax=Kibdelosporangium banguiense TaxID=1365924 RepID=A0ABS4TXP3_9PSEU|nr:Gfo/Idh/MocA family oxidoreductase [Kibdelosporangium banguiense]MBP2329152.1 NDP-hexose-3-ketoreductase [Kibdelosporangium banguiense]
MTGSDSSAVRIGVLGASSIARRRMLPVLRDDKTIELVAVASRDRQKAERFAAEFGGAAVHHYQALLERDDIDAVYLPVPNALHYRWAREAIILGRHVLAEKPLTTCAADTADLAKLAASKGVVLRENIAFLHHGLHKQVANMVRDGRIGALTHVDASFCFPPLPADDVRYRPELGGGALLDVGVYVVRLAQYFLGEELTVAGAALRQDPSTGVDVGGSAVLCSATGQTATLTFGFEHSYRSHYMLWGSTSRLSVDRAFTPPPTHAPVVRIDEQDHTEETTFPAEHQFAASAAAFAAAVRHARRTGSDPDHGQWAAASVRTAELLDGIAAIAHRSEATPV